MIVKMKKVSLVVQTKDKDEALKGLAEAAVFHVTAKNINHNEALARLLDERAMLDGVLSGLPNVKQHAAPNIALDDLVAKIKNTKKLIKKNDERILYLNRERDRIGKWGTFSPDDVKKLEETGLMVRFYETDAKSLKALKECRSDFTVIERAKGKLLLLAVAHAESDFPPFDWVRLPEESLTAMGNEIRMLTIENKKLNDELAVLTKDTKIIKERMTLIDEQIEYEKTYLMMAEHEELAVVEGYVPVPDLNAFKERVAQHKWAALYTDITADDDVSEVPTKTKQYGVGALAQPILSMFDLIPGYREFDITFVMFFFFSLFFGIIVGDGGYGAIFLAVGLILILKNVFQRKRITTAHILWVWLSLVTLVWGAINGSWFGFEQITAMPPFKQFVVEWITDDNNMMYFSFLVGIIHLSLGHIWAFVRKVRTNFWASFAELGNMAMLFGFFFLILMLILGRESIPKYTVHAIIIGLVVVILFGSQERGQNVFKGMLSGLANSFPKLLGSISNFSDIISYVRLYAVGLAGASIAMAFNNTAMSISEPFNVIATPLVILVAHTINIVLALLSVIVHALRLNTLEFSSHLGLEWTGFQYKPFKAKNNILRGE
jgi:V/A-type H+-transporting ATPase subunit I